MKNRILFLINPVSGIRNKSGLSKTFKSLCNKNGLDCRIVETKGKDDRFLLEKELADYRPEIVVVCGGDGTVNLAGSVLTGREEKMAIFPTGSANGLATDLGIRADTNELFATLTEGKVLRMDVLMVNENLPCFHLADAGFNATLIRNFEQGGKRGLVGYSWHFLKTLFTHRHTVKAKFTIDGKKSEQSTLMITFANARKYGTGAIVNPGGNVEDGRFEVCNFKDYPRWNILKLTADFFTGKLNQSRYVDITSAKTVRVQLAEAMPLQVDGELQGEKREIEVRIKAQKLKVLISGQQAGQYSRSPIAQ